jgi:3-methylcrotonyl-CoA carboxylase alpha subunit
VISSLLIANRGEIARRVIRTARRLGVRTIAVYSEADAGAPHVRDADAAVAIGPAAARDSYLSPDAILTAALVTGAQAIHPGYGFLSENADFAQSAIDAGLVWVGPPPAAIRAMGLKDAAKRLMSEAGVPVTPGYLGEDQSPQRLQGEADAIGYPVLIKAVAGGGGKGMREVARGEDFPEALASCRREAAASFGDDRVLIERLVAHPRHIEVQVFADSHGAAVHLFERDCSLQRRHQKVIEEAPAPGMDAAVRAAVCGAAVRAALAVGYQGAGTVEFIADAGEGLRADRIWFMEMNTRLQVEHPITEEITGLDLVEWQLRVASGEPLPLAQDDIRLNGWAMEARLYAENPAAGFLPSTGPLDRFVLPDGVRIETGVEQGGAISPFYDPMIAKLVAHAATREAAAAKLAEACRQVQVWPVRTNAGFLARALADPDFVAGRVDTGFIARRLERLLPPAEPPQAVVRAAAAARLPAPGADPWSALAGFRVGAAAAVEAAVQAGETVYRVALSPGETPALPVLKDGDDIVVFDAGEAWAFTEPRAKGLQEGDGGDGKVVSPMPGRIVAVHVAEGDVVAKGQPLITLEAMKMEHAMTAPFAGKVERLTVKVGDQTAEGVTLAVLVREE